MRVGVYVDGFNLYYGGRGQLGSSPGWKWMDLRAIAAIYATWQGSTVERVVYCTARERHRRCCTNGTSRLLLESACRAWSRRCCRRGLLRLVGQGVRDECRPLRDEESVGLQRSNSKQHMVGRLVSETISGWHSAGDDPEARREGLRRQRGVSPSRECLDRSSGRGHRRVQ